MTLSWSKTLSQFWPNIIDGDVGDLSCICLQQVNILVHLSTKITGADRVKRIVQGETEKDSTCVKTQ